MGLDEKIKELEKLKKDDRYYADPDSYSILGNDFHELGRTDLVKEVLELAVKREQADEYAYYNLGRIQLFNEKNAQKALETLNAARTLGKTTDRTFYLIGHLYQEYFDDKERAIEVFEEARSKDQTIKFTYNDLYALYLEKGDEEKALAIAQEARGKKQATQAIYTELMLAQEGKPEALALALEAIDQEETNPGIFNYATLALFQEDNHEKIIEVAEKARSQDQMSEKIYPVLVNAYNELGRDEDIIAILEEARAKNMANKDSYRQLIQEYATRGESSKAKEVFDEARDQGKTDAAQYSYILMLLMQEHNEEEQRALLKEARSTGNMNSIIYTKIAENLTDEGKDKEAFELLEEARMKGEMNSFSYDLLTRHTSQQKGKKQALKVLAEGWEKGEMKQEEYVKLAMALEHPSRKRILEENKQEPWFDANYYADLLLCYDLEKDHMNVIKTGEEARKKGKMNEWIYFYLSYGYYESEREEESLEVLSEARSKGEMNEGSLYLLSKLRLRKDQPQEAKEVLEEALERGYDNVAIRTALLDITDDEEHMERLYEIAINEPGETIALYELGKHADDKTYKGLGKTDFLRMMTQRLREQGKLASILEEDSSSSHIVMRPRKESLYKESIFIKQSKQPFDEEMRIRKKLEGILAKHELETSIPSFVDHFKEGDIHYYVTTFEEGGKLTNAIMVRDIGEMLFPMHHFNVHERDLSDAYFILTDTQALIYAGYPGDELEMYDFRGKLKEKGYSDNVIEAAEPIIDFLEKSTYLSYYLDGWSDNVIMSKHGLTIVDTENRGKAPFAMNIAQLLNCVPAEPFEETLKYVSFAEQQANKHLGKKSSRAIKDDGRFRTEYALATIYRSLLNVVNRGENAKEYLEGYLIGKSGLEAIQWLNEKVRQKDLEETLQPLKDTLKQKSDWCYEKAKESYRENVGDLTDIITFDAMWDMHVNRIAERRRIAVKALDDALNETGLKE